MLSAFFLPGGAAQVLSWFGFSSPCHAEPDGCIAPKLLHPSGSLSTRPSLLLPCRRQPLEAFAFCSPSFLGLVVDLLPIFSAGSAKKPYTNKLQNPFSPIFPPKSYHLGGGYPPGTAGFILGTCPFPTSPHPPHLPPYSWVRRNPTCRTYVEVCRIRGR